MMKVWSDIMFQNFIEKLKEKDYKTHFLIAWIFSYLIVHIGMDFKYEGMILLKYQPFTAIILGLAYLYYNLMILLFKTPKEQDTFWHAAFSLIKATIIMILFLKTIYTVCSVAYENGIDLWFLWGDNSK